MTCSSSETSERRLSGLIYVSHEIERWEFKKSVSLWFLSSIIWFVVRLQVDRCRSQANSNSPDFYRLLGWPINQLHN